MNDKNQSDAVPLPVFVCADRFRIFCPLVEMKGLGPKTFYLGCHPQ